GKHAWMNALPDVFSSLSPRVVQHGHGHIEVAICLVAEAEAMSAPGICKHLFQYVSAVLNRRLG
ncbi:hypothetical protein ODI84_16120, partial [Pseudomonas putida]|uniref:hypothetical protein n=1 Tax=Pseudomonas putida TaxID=303 RepID=UPI002D1F5A8B